MKGRAWRIAWPKSLKRRLIAQLLLFQAGILLVVGVAIVAYLIEADTGGMLTSPEFAEAAARAIERGPDGKLRLVETAEILRFRQSVPDFWFVARATSGEIVTEGRVPAVYLGFVEYLDRITYADFRDTSPSHSLLALARTVSGPQGDFVVLGKGDLYSVTFVVLFLSNVLMIPIITMITIITIIIIPVIVGRAFSRFASIAREAAGIDIDRRGYRLPLDGVPSEIAPLVNAVNGALQRLDEGYERQQRFILDAAHELRTPIAILQTRVETLPEGPARTRILADAARVGGLAEQLLDLQRIDAGGKLFERVDLVGLCQGVVADLAPMAIAQGYELSLESEVDQEYVTGDAAAIERALVNLVQNAIEHAGRKGDIVVRVERGGRIEIIDQGPGVPQAERETIFEPFHRLNRRDSGAGLGLSLVRQIMERHGGNVSVIDTPYGGACFRLDFPKDRARR